MSDLAPILQGFFTDRMLTQKHARLHTSRTDTTLVSWLTDAESNALLAAPNRGSWFGHRDYALLLTALRTGLRVSELIRLACRNLHLGTGAYVRCVGKGLRNAAPRSTR